MGKHAADDDADQPAAKRSKAEDEVLSGVSEDGLMAELHRRGLATGEVHTAIAAQVDDNYITGKELGHGASAAVYEVTHKFSKNKFAMKVSRGALLSPSRTHAHSLPYLARSARFRHIKQVLVLVSQEAYLGSPHIVSSKAVQKHEVLHIKNDDILDVPTGRQQSWTGA